MWVYEIEKEKENLWILCWKHLLPGYLSVDVLGVGCYPPLIRSLLRAV